MDTAIVTTLIASASAVGGVLIKMAYDVTVARRDSKRAAVDTFWTTGKRHTTNFGQYTKLLLTMGNACMI